MKLIRSRKEAKELGLTRYFTGHPCKHGHVAERDVINATCVECSLGWKRRNAERVLQYAKDWYYQNREHSLKVKKKYLRTEAGKAAMKRTREKNRENCIAASREWRKKYPERDKKSQDNWYANNGLKRHHYKYRNDPNYKLGMQLRSRIRHAIKSKRAGSAVRDLGCSINELRFYLEGKFYGEMSWDGWGKVWELDHIKPLASFDLTNRKQFLQAAHYTNLQPLLKSEHWVKSAREREIMTTTRGCKNG